MIDLLLSLPLIFTPASRRGNDYASYVGEAATADVLYERALQATIVDFNRAAHGIIHGEKQEREAAEPTAQSDR